MQKLNSRNTPTSISHACSNCGQSLKDFRGKVGVADVKTVFNNPDATLTTKRQVGQNSHVSAVYVLNTKGNPLMPCKPRKAKILLKQGKAKVINLLPFTIQLLNQKGGATQDIILGVDIGYSHIGLSAINKKEEIYAQEIHLREDLVKLNSERRAYRRNRRYRKTWKRKPRFLNRKKKDGWLPPSIQHKLDSHIKAIKIVIKILPISKIRLEVASFDIQKIKNPEILSEEYQKGETNNFYNVREYVLHRDNHRCQHCKGKEKDSILNVHHIISRQIGGDRPDNLITLCRSCHKKLHKGEIKLKIEFKKTGFKKLGFKAETFMSSIRWKLIEEIKNQDQDVSITYGYITKSKRINLNLPKSHVIDAFVIAGGITQKRQSSILFTKQVRKCNRKLFKGSRSHIKNTSSRFIQGFQRFDKVLYNGKECFIFGRRKTGYFDLRKLNKEKIHSSAKAKDCILLETSKTFLTEKRSSISSMSKDRGFHAVNAMIKNIIY